VANLILAEPSLSDAGTLYSVTSASSVAPATNLQTTQPKEVTETTSATGSFLWHIDLGASASYDLVALLFTNLSATATWAISTSASIATGFSDILVSTTFRAAGQAGHTRPHGFYLHGSTLTAPDHRYLRITIADASNPDGVIRLGRLYVAKVYQPTANADVGAALGFEDTSPIFYTSAGESIATVNEPLPTASFSLTATGAAAWAEVQANLYELYRKRGASQDMLMIFDPTDASYAGRLIRYGRLQQRFGITYPAPFQTYQAAFEIRGMI
jgi:hypothetical protein